MKKTLDNYQLPAAIILAGFIFLTSCKKDTNNNPSNPDPALTAEAVQNESHASAQFQEVFNISMGVDSDDAGEDIGLGTGGGIVYRSSASLRTTTARCFTVTVTPQVLHQFPKTVTVDFGSGCKGNDGKIRKGKIVTVFSGPMIIPGSKATINFVNYSVDSFSVAGTMAVQNTSTANKTAWSITVTDGKISNTISNRWVAWSGTREYKQTEGNDTPFNPLDDAFEITGNSKGSNSNGNSWTTLVLQPVVKKTTCEWFSKGQVQITRNNLSGVLDFGDGSCDNMATLQIFGKTYPITLP